MGTQTTYNYKVVRQFAIMTVVWGIVGMLVGVIIAAQLAFPEMLNGISFLTYGRLRPLHTNAVIFAFGGSALFATSYYIVQRTCQTRLFSDGPFSRFTSPTTRIAQIAHARNHQAYRRERDDTESTGEPLNARATSAAVGKRLVMSFDRQRRQISSKKEGMSSLTCRGGLGSLCRISSRHSSDVSVMNGCRPVNNS